MFNTKSLLALFGACVSGFSLLSAGNALGQSKELLLYSWSNYTPPEMLRRFEAETGIKVRLDTYDTNDALLAKLEAGGTGYDIIVPSGGPLRRLIAENRLLRIDAKSMPNAKNLKHPFDSLTFDPDRAYSVPYMWGTTGIGYDTAKVKGGKLEDTWKELFEPREEVAGKIAMLSEINGVINAASYYLGIQPCTEKNEDAQRILELLQKQKPAVKLYNSGGTIDRLGTGEVVMHMMWSGSAVRAQRQRSTIAYLYPKEGLTLWTDNFAVPKGAPNLENAKIFLNWMMDPKNAAEASNFTGYNNAITGSEPYLKPELASNPMVNPAPEAFARIREETQCGKAAIDLAQRIWTRLLR